LREIFIGKLRDVGLLRPPDTTAVSGYDGESHHYKRQDRQDAPIRRAQKGSSRLSKLASAAISSAAHLG